MLLRHARQLARPQLMARAAVPVRRQGSISAVRALSGRGKTPTVELVKLLHAEHAEEKDNADMEDLRETAKRALEESPFKQVNATGRLLRFENINATDSPYVVSITMDPADVVFPDDEDMANPESSHDTEVPAKLEVKLRGSKSNASLLITGVLYATEGDEGNTEPGSFVPEKVIVKRDNGSKLVKDYSPDVSTLDEQVQAELDELIVEMGVDPDLVRFSLVRARPPAALTFCLPRCSVQASWILLVRLLLRPLAIDHREQARKA